MFIHSLHYTGTARTLILINIISISFTYILPNPEIIGNIGSFFKNPIISTSDFLKHFDLVKEDHKGFVEPTRIKLKCKAIKKFLPYNGFYPCQRTVEIAQQFYSSYANGIAVADAGTGFSYAPLEDTSKIGFQNLLAPLFAPGVLFNSIKTSFKRL